VLYIHLLARDMLFHCLTQIDKFIKVTKASNLDVTLYCVSTIIITYNLCLANGLQYVCITNTVLVADSFIPCKLV